MHLEDIANSVISHVGPNAVSETLRRNIYDYMRQLIFHTINSNIKPPDSFVVFRYGSVPLMTYLSDGDLDLGFAVFEANGSMKSQEACDNYLELLYQRFTKRDIFHHQDFPISNPTLVDAEVRVFKCSIQNIAVDISANKIGGCCSYVMLDLLDQVIGRDHLFKRSIVLIKSWCAYESHTLGSRNGLMSTYALEILIINLFYLFNDQLATPLQVLFKFLDHYSTFDWESNVVTACGPIPFTTFNEIVNKQHSEEGSGISFEKVASALNPNEQGINILRLIENCRKRFKHAYENYGYITPKSTWRYLKTPHPNFVIKSMNVVDPLNNNNTGRSVSECGFFRTRAAFKKGAQTLKEIIEQSHSDRFCNEFLRNTTRFIYSGYRHDFTPHPLICFKLNEYRLPVLHQNNLTPNLVEYLNNGTQKLIKSTNCDLLENANGSTSPSNNHIDPSLSNSTHLFNPAKGLSPPPFILEENDSEVPDLLLETLLSLRMTKNKPKAKGSNLENQSHEKPSNLQFHHVYESDTEEIMGIIDLVKRVWLTTHKPPSIPHIQPLRTIVNHFNSRSPKSNLLMNLSHNQQIFTSDTQSVIDTTSNNGNFSKRGAYIIPHNRSFRRPIYQVEFDENRTVSPSLSNTRRKNGKWNYSKENYSNKNKKIYPLKSTSNDLFVHNSSEKPQVNFESVIRELIKAIKAHDINQVESILNEHPDLDLNNNTTYALNPLIMAIECEATNIAKRLINYKKIDINLYVEGSPPLQDAISYNNLELVKSLVDKNANIEEYFLYLAAKRNHLEIFKVLLEHFKDKNFLSKHGEEILKVSIKQINEKDNMNYEFMHWLINEFITRFSPERALDIFIKTARNFARWDFSIELYFMEQVIPLITPHMDSKNILKIFEENQYFTLDNSGYFQKEDLDQLLLEHLVENIDINQDQDINSSHSIETKT